MELKKTLLVLSILSIFIFLFTGVLIVYKANNVLVTEIIPTDKDKIPVPKEGDKIQVYGPWVEDVGHIIPVSWNEIHPIRYLKNNNSKESGGQMQQSKETLLGVHSPFRLIILDKENPYRNATGIVDDVFYEYDGDIHIEIIPDEDTKQLLKIKNLPHLPIKLGELRTFAIFLFKSVIPIIALLTIVAYTVDYLKKFFI